HRDCGRLHLRDRARDQEPLGRLRMRRTRSQNCSGLSTAASARISWASAVTMHTTTAPLLRATPPPVPLRANPDGTDIDQRFVTGDFIPVGVAVDRDHVYWTGTDPGTIG